MMKKNDTALVAAVASTAEPISEANAERRMDTRSPALDVIRIFACFSVIAIHFLLNSGFYSIPVVGGRMYGMVFYRALFSCCVPLYMMLSGYLLCNKKLERKYYGRIWRILFVYLASSLFCIYGYRFLYQRFYGLLGLAAMEFPPISFWEFGRKILNYEGSRYAWYVEMYLGLFLLIPFLNLIYHHLPNQKTKQFLILTGFVLSFLPTLVNSFNLTQPGWWANPTMRDQNGSFYPFTNLIPDYWRCLYPFTYYFVGCYLREYGLKLKLWTNLLLLICSVALYGGFILWRCNGQSYIDGTWSDWNTPFTLAIAVSLFCLFLNRSYRRVPVWMKKLLSRLSELTLGAYLVSDAFDRLIYPSLKQRQPIEVLRMDAFVIIVPIVFVCSMFTAWLIQLLYALLQRAGRLLHKES
ncbi:MAG: acyltransferase family protein [Oscillospiraceae bacterium]|nr:acyltransferase family protein [Oscillospiraceae bacterium]